MSPYDIEKRTYHDVLRLYADVRAMQIRDAKDNDQQSNSNTTKVIRRRAGDDWF
nr:MAG TPA: hypothetical protein [Caudoviricetes sp.]